MAGRTRRGKKEEDGVNKLFPPATTTAATQVMPWRKRGEKGEGENGIFHAWGLLGGLAKEVKESFSLLQSIVKEAEVVFFSFETVFFVACSAVLLKFPSLQSPCVLPALTAAKPVLNLERKTWHRR